MKRLLTWLGLGIAGVLTVVVLVVVVLCLRGRAKAGGGPMVAARGVTPAADSASLARGRHLVEAVTPCEACHGPGLGGQPFDMPAALVRMAAPNLTKGRGGVGASYTPADWDRAIRHGVAKDGRRLVVMPSEAYTNLTDEDLAAILAYVDRVPPADKELPPRRVGIVGAALVGAGAFPLAADVINHDSVGTRRVALGVTPEYGRYLVDIASCRVCHGEKLEGRTGNNGPPAGPSLIAVARLWTFDGFRTTLRTGRDPGGHELPADRMPWPSFSHMTDDEMQAIWMYLRTLTPSTPAAAQ